ncbi:dephospho-CoA kinase [Metabacillus iocasae]|uniref:Dephospho-CoA kinase n=1 Tax=Priestia iocasae TaxID=2291674 RepID=A0ABS2QP65_9BACI|nr:dephospho-CoA kinase [Metabacillus iocasae]MBM7701246.1 dephospho-CoA kinase [Metabacillus iocasae]
MAVVIGLTGGIASGKSTVAFMMEQLEIPVIDADKIAKEVVEVGTDAYHKIVKTFGERILQENGSIDRATLGSIIFPNKEEREKLNKIVHPAVREMMLRKKEQLLHEGNEIVVLDIPLLFESDLTHLVDKVLVVYVDEDVQLERLLKRNQLTEEEAKSRIQSQLPLVQKVALADAVINNNGSIEETKAQLLSALAYWNK